MAQYTRTTTVDSGPAGDSVKQAVVDVDADLTGIVAAYNTHDTATTSVHGFTGAKTGSGAMVGATSPTLVTPVLGVATATSINKVALTAPATGSTLTIADGKTLTVSETSTLTTELHVTAPATHIADAAAGFTIAGGTTSKTLTVELDSLVNQDLTTDASPTFATVKLSGLTDLKVPKHVADATGLADTTITVSANNEVTNASQPAFSAYNSLLDENVTGDGTDLNPLNTFDTERFDKNADFDSSTGVFTAPVTGSYLFTFTLALAGLAAGHDIEVWLNTSNATYYWDMVYSNTTVYLNYTVIAELDAADTASIRLRVSGGSKTVDITGSYTTFMGALLF